MRYSVRYPSGKRFRLQGRFAMANEPLEAGLGPAPCVIQVDDSAILLDPRAIVKDGDGQVIYSPRMVALDEHLQWVRDWLAANPAWAASSEATP